jgi:hypothetical protein
MRRRAPWLLLGVTTTAAVFSLGFGELASADVPMAIALAAFTFAFAGVGATLAARVPASPLGWIMCSAGLVVGLIVFADSWGQAYANDPSDGRPGSLVALWFSNWAWVLAVGPTATFLLLLFPTGRLPSPRWRPVARTAAAALLVGTVGLALEPGPIEGYPHIVNPVGVEGAGPVSGLALLALSATAIASVASLGVRYRHAGFRERQQLKWLLWAAGLVALVIAAIAGTGLAGVKVSDNLINGGMVGALTAVPLAIGIAILRHGLFDIDVVINRTLVYGALTATLGVAYLAFVLLLQLLLSPLTEDSDLAIAGSTLAAAALFRPARARIQALVDRRFYRRKYDASRTMATFGARLRDEIELDALAGDLRAVVGETMQPAHISIWLRESPR